MKICLLIIICVIIFGGNIFGINHYNVNDTLLVISDNVNLLKDSKLDAEVIMRMNKGATIVTLQPKHYKDRDFSVLSDESDWSEFVTGRWVKVSIDNEVGYMNDAFLSHYNIDSIGIGVECLKRDTFKVASYEWYTRTICSNGIVVESGTGMEWGIEIYMIPNFSLEEAIYFIKKNYIDYNFGDKNWIKNEDGVILTESSDVSYMNLKITKLGESIVIKIEDGM